MIIRILKEYDAQLYQELRLTGLKVNSEAFGSTFESEVNLPLEGRGQGLGKSLMVELIKLAKFCDGLEQINLAVVSENVSAKRLYKSVGFEVYGVERNALKFNNQYFDEDLMVLYI